MNSKIWAVMLLAIFLLPACTAFSGPGEAEGPPDEMEEMVFEEEEVEEGEEEMEFEDEEGMEIYLDAIPPSGDWLLTEHAGTITCAEGQSTSIPAEAPEMVDITVSEDGMTLSFPTAEGVAILTQYELSAEGDVRFSFYEGTIMVEGEPLTIDLQYNLAGNGEIFGTIELPFDGCRINRNFEAEFIGPVE